MTDKQAFNYGQVVDPYAKRAFQQIAQILGGLTGLNNVPQSKIIATLSMMGQSRANTFYPETLSAPPLNPMAGMLCRPDGVNWIPSGADGSKLFYYDGATGAWMVFGSGGGGAGGGIVGDSTHAYATVATSLIGANYTKVTLDATAWDNIGTFDTSTSTWTPTDPGTYAFIGVMFADGQTSGNRRLGIQIQKSTSGGAYAEILNGGWNSCATSAGFGCNLTGLEIATAADSYRLYGWIDQTHNTAPGIDVTYLQIVRMR